MKDGLAGVIKFMGYELPSLESPTGSDIDIPKKGGGVNSTVPSAGTMPSFVPLSGFNIPDISIPDWSPVPTAFEQNISMPIPSGGLIPPSDSGGIEIINNFTIEGGIIDDPIYWQNLVRQKVIPEIDSELERYGKRLGG